MVSPNPTNATGPVSGAPPGAYDPYKALIAALPLPDGILSLLKPTFDRMGFPLQLDQSSVTDYSNNPLPHYRVETEKGKVFLIHLAEDVAGNAYGQISLITIASTFLKEQSRALIVVSEVESFAFNTEALIDTWKVNKPDLEVRFVTLPLIQQLEVEQDGDKRFQNLRGLLNLDALLVSTQASLEQQIEAAYKQARLDLLNNLKGLPERLNKEDRTTILDKLVDFALAANVDPKTYLIDLVKKLGLGQEISFIIPTFNGNPISDSTGLLIWLEEKTYPNGPVQGYKRVLGYLLSLIADEGGGREIALIIFKYKLVADGSTLQALVTKFP